ncbi:hypothetical protein WN51_12882 [Melipona quadrifasciata]|uniref:Uncharacterized protein n=1 Tax=Melipona quadrifasciata TaxID=166423 RepID=A0A0M9A2Q8_9HYME|nr:hypothetical protein WN51_12882 [Melipona quadrifasciata]
MRTPFLCGKCFEHMLHAKLMKSDWLFRWYYADMRRRLARRHAILHNVICRFCRPVSPETLATWLDVFGEDKTIDRGLKHGTNFPEHYLSIKLCDQVAPNPNITKKSNTSSVIWFACIQFVPPMNPLLPRFFLKSRPLYMTSLLARILLAMNESMKRYSKTTCSYITTTKQHMKRQGLGMRQGQLAKANKHINVKGTHPGAILPGP